MYEIGVWKYEMIKRMLDNTIVPRFPLGFLFESIKGYSPFYYWHIPTKLTPHYGMLTIP